MTPLLLGAAVQLPPSVILAKPSSSKNFESYYSTYRVEAELLEDRNHIQDLNLPNLTSAGGTNRPRYFQLRGIGERSAYEGMPNSSVSVIIDNIDYTGVGGVLSLQGSQSLEVYKGPQNTLIGPSALAGMIISSTKSPKNKSSSFHIERSSFNTTDIGLQQSLSYSDINAFLSVNYLKSDGYFTNTYLNREDTNHRDELSIKSRIDFNDFSLALHSFDFNNGYDIFNFTNSKNTTSDKPGSDDQRTHGISLSHNYKKSTFQIKSIASGHLTDTLYSYDEDWGNDPFWNSLAGWNQDYDYDIKFTHKIKTLSLDERLIQSNGRFTHQTGVYFKHYSDKSREWGFKNESPRKDVKAELQRQKFSLYHETQYDLNSGMTLFSGVRAESVNSSYEDNNLNYYNPSEVLWGARLGASIEAKSANYSLSLSRGFKPGGVNIGSSISSDRRVFSDEVLYSLALKMELNKERWSLTSDLFYNLRENIQVKTSYQDNPSDPSSYTFYTDNGTRGRGFGGELTANYQATDWYNVKFIQAYNVSEYSHYQYGARNLKGRSFSYAPEYDLLLTNTFNINRDISFSIENQYRDSFYFGNSHDEVSPKTFMTNFQIQWSFKKLKASLWGRNIFNDRSETRAFFFGNRPPNFNDERFVQVGPPASYGVRVRYSF